MGHGQMVCWFDPYSEYSPCKTGSLSHFRLGLRPDILYQSPLISFYLKSTPPSRRAAYADHIHSGPRTVVGIVYLIIISQYHKSRRSIITPPSLLLRFFS